MPHKKRGQIRDSVPRFFGFVFQFHPSYVWYKDLPNKITSSFKKINKKLLVLVTTIGIAFQSNGTPFSYS